jgi:hypothetical protein|tara:strand:+ start:6589 stop:6942 length:354 start_codon:yes stop_codon:yes gene_type:complete
LTLTGEDYLVNSIERIGKFSKSELIYSILNDINIGLTNLDENLNSIKSYQSTISKIEELKTPINYKKLFQVDTHLQLNKNQLNKEHLKSINKGVTLLNKLTLQYANSRVEGFKRRFK